MVTYFNRKDLVSFVSYLLSEKRKALHEEAYQEAIKNGIDDPLPVNDSLKEVYQADIDNWINSL